MKISYPFYLSEETGDIKGSSNSYCGYPGLGIVCDDGKAILETDNGENYTVTSIQGRTANLSFPDLDVVDASCPRVEQNVTSFGPGAWLDFPPSTVDYLVFFLGSIFKPGLPPPTIGQIICPGFADYYPGQSFIFTDDSAPAGNWSQECIRIIKVPVLNQGYINPNDTTWRNTGYGEVLRQGFQVSWDNDNKPEPCAQCEESNGRCAYNETGGFLGCLCANGQINDKSCGKYNSTPKHFSIWHPIFQIARESIFVFVLV